MDLNTASQSAGETAGNTLPISALSKLRVSF